MDMLGSSPAPAPTNQPAFGFGQVQQPAAYGMGMGMGGMHRPTQSISAQPPQYASMMQSQPQSLFGGPMKPTSPINSSFSPSTRHGTASPSTQAKAAAPAASANFDDLWSLSLGGGTAKPVGGASGAGKSIKDLEKEKAMAGLWGGQKPGGGSNAGAGAGAGAGGFGSFGNSTLSGGGDDLLL
jgi:epsin